MRKTKKTIVILSLSICLIVLIISVINRENTQRISTDEHSGAEIEKKNSIKSVESPETIEEYDGELGYSERFNADEDYFYLALELFDASRNGDIEAQYYLAKVLLTCKGTVGLKERYSDDDYSAYETRLEQDLIETLLAKCSQFDEDNFDRFGVPKDWVIRSANSGYGPALIGQLIMSEGPSKSDKLMTDIKNAILSQNPEVMYIFSSFFRNNEDHSVWKILACEYGFNCSSSSSEDWIYPMASRCAEQIRLESSDWGKRCIAGVSLQESIELRHGAEDYALIIQQAKTLKNLIDNDMLADNEIARYFNMIND